jgi:hypothetical protein
MVVMARHQAFLALALPMLVAVVVVWRVSLALAPLEAAAGGSGVVIISYAGSQVFGGGTVTSSGGNTIHTFTSSGSLVPAYGVEYLVVAGGGGAQTGGGGAGGFRTASGFILVKGTSYTVTVGMAVRVVALGVQAPAVLAVQETRQVPHPHKELMVVAHQPQAHIPLVVEAVHHQQGRRVLVLLAGLVVLVQHHQ